jgi:ribosomal protein S18 acetylase RimI-like enzyme
VTTDYTIRVATDFDIPVVRALFQDYAASLGIDLGYQGFDAELAALPGAYAPPAGALLLAVSPRAEPLGCVAIRPLTEPDTCEMKRLYAAPQARGCGVGRALAVAAMDAARQAGYRVMFLDTLPTMGTAQALYRGLGFETTPPYYDSPIAGTLFMRKLLALP